MVNLASKKLKLTTVMKSTTFVTERLLLKPTDEQDSAFILKLFNSPKFLQNIGDRNIRTLTDSRAYIREKIISQHQRLGYGVYTIIPKGGHEKIGICGLFDREGLKGIDLGFAMLPSHEGKGYAFEAANKIKEVATEEYQLKCLLAITSKDNSTSQRLLERLDFYLRGSTRLPGNDEVLLLYGTTGCKS